MINLINSANCKPKNYEAKAVAFKGTNDFDEDYDSTDTYSSEMLSQERKQLRQELNDKSDDISSSAEDIKKVSKSKYGKIASPALKIAEIGLFAVAGWSIGKAKFLHNIVKTLSNKLLGLAHSDLKTRLLGGIINKIQKFSKSNFVKNLSTKIETVNAKSTALKELKASLGEGEKVPTENKLKFKDHLYQALGFIIKPAKSVFTVDPKGLIGVIKASSEYKQLAKGGFAELIAKNPDYAELIKANKPENEAIKEIADKLKITEIIENSKEYKQHIEDGIAPAEAFTRVAKTEMKKSDAVNYVFAHKSPKLQDAIEKYSAGKGLNTSLRLVVGTTGATVGAYEGATTPLNDFPDKVKEKLKEAEQLLV